MNILLNDVLNYALNNNIGFNLLPNLSPYDPSFSICNQRQIIINMNWINKKELPFIAAHEIGHILNGDNGDAYFSPSINLKYEIERKANLKAVDILLPIYLNECSNEISNNIFTIMNQLGIPYSLKKFVIKKIKDLLN